MFDDPAIDRALRTAARRNNVDASALRQAVEHESVEELALALDIAVADAARRMARLQRIVVYTGDWGAGCRLLTDQVRDELLAMFDGW